MLEKLFCCFHRENPSPRPLPFLHLLLAVQQCVFRCIKNLKNLSKYSLRPNANVPAGMPTSFYQYCYKLQVSAYLSLCLSADLCFQSKCIESIKWIWMAFKKSGIKLKCWTQEKAFNLSLFQTALFLHFILHWLCFYLLRLFCHFRKKTVSFAISFARLPWEIKFSYTLLQLTQIVLRFYVGKILEKWNQWKEFPFVNLSDSVLASK